MSKKITLQKFTVAYRTFTGGTESVSLDVTCAGVTNTWKYGTVSYLGDPKKGQDLTSSTASAPIDCGGGDMSFTVTTSGVGGKLDSEVEIVRWSSFQCLYNHLLSVRFDLPDVVGGVGGQFSGSESCSASENYGGSSPVPTSLPRCCEKKNSHYEFTFKVDDDSDVNRIGYVMEFKKVSMKTSGSDGVVHFLSNQKSTSVRILAQKDTSNKVGSVVEPKIIAEDAVCQKSVKSALVCSSVVAFCQKGTSFNVTFGVIGSAFLSAKNLQCNDYFDFNKKESDGFLNKKIAFGPGGSDPKSDFSYGSSDNHLEVYHWALDYVDLSSYGCTTFLPWVKTGVPSCSLV